MPELRSQKKGKKRIAVMWVAVPAPRARPEKISATGSAGISFSWFGAGIRRKKDKSTINVANGSLKNVPE